MDAKGTKRKRAVILASEWDPNKIEITGTEIQGKGRGDRIY